MLIDDGGAVGLLDVCWLFSLPLVDLESLFGDCGLFAVLDKLRHRHLTFGQVEAGLLALEQEGRKLNYSVGIGDLPRYLSLSLIVHQVRSYEVYRLRVVADLTPCEDPRPLVGVSANLLVLWQTLNAFELFVILLRNQQEGVESFLQCSAFCGGNGDHRVHNLHFGIPVLNPAAIYGLHFSDFGYPNRKCPARQRYYFFKLL